MQLDSFLKQKPLFYDLIDYERMPKIYQSIRAHFKLPKIIHVVGTNGKGTTGRFLAQMLYANTLHVGHYTSPHILRFNERIWIDGNDVDDQVLEVYHQRLLTWLEPAVADSLSYFEYTTLLAMAIFCDQCDYVVLEAGLGGEHDATAIFPKILSVVTPIGLDHQAFLGNSISAITHTKLNSLTTDCVLAKQYTNEVYPIALQKTDVLEAKLYDVETYFDQDMNEKIRQYALHHKLASFLKDNFTTALCALTVLGYDIPLESFSPMILRGRCQKILPNVTMDVGHNEMAADALCKTFDGKKVVLIYNSYKDKDYPTILKRLKPIIEEILVIAIDSPRAAEEADIYHVAHELKLPISSFSTLHETKEYLVFGSFSVVEAFLKVLGER